MEMKLVETAEVDRPLQIAYGVCFVCHAPIFAVLFDARHFKHKEEAALAKKEKKPSVEETVGLPHPTFCPRCSERAKKIGEKYQDLIGIIHYHTSLTIDAADEPLATLLFGSKVNAMNPGIAVKADLFFQEELARLISTRYSSARNEFFRKNSAD